MEQPSVEEGNSTLSFSLIFFSIFVHISGFIRVIMPILVKSDDVEERPKLVTAGYGQHGSQWVNLVKVTCK